MQKNNDRRFYNRTGRLCQQAIDDLKKSGLADSVLEEAKIEIFKGSDPDLKKAIGYASKDGMALLNLCDLLAFPYFDRNGKVVYTRFKPYPAIDSKKKYIQPLKKPSKPYILPRVWSVSEKPNKPIWITEGEKKALKLIQEGRYAIALSGVWAFKSGKDSLTTESDKQMWAELKNFNLNGRIVFLGFDSDLWVNLQVRQALYELAVKLTSLKAIVRIATWSEGKGIDDHLATFKDCSSELDDIESESKNIYDFAKPEHANEVIRALGSADFTPVTLEQMTNNFGKSLGIRTSLLKKQLAFVRKNSLEGIDEFFERFALIRRTESILDLQTKKTLKFQSLILEYPELAKVWKNSENKKIINVEDIVFKPQGCKDNEINLFDGLDIAPKQGDCLKIYELLFHLCEEKAELTDWVIKWLAYPLQHIGAKMRTSLIVHGGQGSGKNLFFQDIMCSIYGGYSSYLTQDKLEEKYTDWASAKLFILCDEVIANRQQAKMKNLLKSYVTQDVINVRRMYEPGREEENHCNFVFLSNESLPILIDTDDRRYVVTRQEKKKEESFYNDVAKEIRNGGVEAFYDLLLNYDLGDFNEFTKPIATEAKKELTEICEPAPIRFAMLWQDCKLDVPFCSCTCAELYEAFLLWCMDSNEYGSYTRTRFTQEINRLIQKDRLLNVSGGQVVRLENRIKRYWKVNISLEEFKRFEPDTFTYGLPDFEMQIKAFNKALDSYRTKVAKTRRF